MTTRASEIQKEKGGTLKTQQPGHMRLKDILHGVLIKKNMNI